MAFALCAWQNHLLLRVINQPLSHQTQKQVRAGNGPLGATYTVEQNARVVASQLQVLVGTLERQAAARARNAHFAATVTPTASPVLARLSAVPQGASQCRGSAACSRPMGVALIFAFVLALLIVLYGLRLRAAGVQSLPAAGSQAADARQSGPVLRRRRVWLLVVLPAAVRFFQNFNSGQFVLVQASQYYHFAGVTLLAMGLLFQVPVGILAATRVGVVSVGQLRRNRRYALLGCGLVAAFLPGDAITLLLETVPLYLLFELSLLVAAIGERQALR